MLSVFVLDTYAVSMFLIALLVSAFLSKDRKIFKKFKKCG